MPEYGVRTWVLPGAIVVASVAVFVLIGIQDRAPVGDLTRDLAATTESAWYLGSVSSVGAFGWVVAGSVSGLAALVLARRSTATPHRESLTIIAALSFLLALDDVLLLHEDVFNRLLGSELPIYGLYAVVGAGWFLRHRADLPSQTIPTLVVAVAAMGGSVLVDLTWSSDADLRLLVEDGLKFLGIWSWALFAALYALDVLDGDVVARA